MKFNLLRAVLGFALCGAVGVANAALVLHDLSTGGTEVVNGAQFIAPPNPEINSGTGLWRPFVRIQTSGNNADSTTGGCDTGAQQYCEQGYNTSDRGVQFDQKGDQNFTRDLKLSDVPVITFNGIKYFEFLLDIGEPDAAKFRLLSLDQLQLFVGPDQATNTAAGDYSSSTGNGSLGTLNALYTLDFNSDDHYIKLNYDLVGQGNGRADMIALIPLSFVPANLLLDGNNSLYLFSRFGDQVTQNAEGSFEEWATIAGSVTCPRGTIDPRCGGGDDEIPEPGSMALVGIGLLAAYAARRRRQ